MRPNVITLQMDNPKEVAIAAQLVAELQREGLAFSAVRENVTHLSGLNGCPGLVISITGY
jgi:hypothetical protein